MEHVAPLLAALKSHKGQFAPVVPFNPGSDQLLPLDFTAANLALTDEILNDNALFSAYINRRLSEAGARYGIGGYNEHRTIYSRSTVFDNASGTEPRRLHLGTDIWGKPHTAVMAPLDGFVHSFGLHPTLGDYGAVIILSHQLDRQSFFTLYGHLSLGSIKNMFEGQRIAAGDVFAEFGIPQDNGWWPPHLHFQVMADMQGWKGDYPGVCAFSERDKWLENCIDPDMILNMNQYL
ncbi:Peptidase family M23 [Cnuella takakiae]|uniref:Peptidase family M23 n=1 Tax=Cnuella takakiae TaxID=1302690 RepID=A0A1M5DC50_9BACT|nr:peptidoglycan DD-metalloendopeptidase family protein [Cnuella takakiae]OLY94022.1 peptidase M23 [Cnuella takakiae]SHF64613.1 Peptidase family M23 [Cnuella takakiae]